VFSARLGPAIEAALDEGYELLAGEAIGALADEFGEDLAAYFEPSP
jgi:tRNA nucleotidyltransferase (CCA-adding enzyme)